MKNMYASDLYPQRIRVFNCLSLYTETDGTNTDACTVQYLFSVYAGDLAFGQCFSNTSRGVMLGRSICAKIQFCHYWVTTKGIQ